MCVELIRVFIIRLGVYYVYYRKQVEILFNQNWFDVRYSTFKSLLTNIDYQTQFNIIICF